MVSSTAVPLNYFVNHNCPTLCRASQRTPRTSVTVYLRALTGGTATSAYRLLPVQFLLSCSISGHVLCADGLRREARSMTTSPFSLDRRHWEKQRLCYEDVLYVGISDDVTVTCYPNSKSRITPSSTGDLAITSIMRNLLRRLVS